MGTKIFITIYIPNSFIVNILLREGKLLSNLLLHPFFLFRTLTAFKCRQPFS